MLDKFSQAFEIFWIVYALVNLAVFFISILTYDPRVSSGFDVKTYFRWFIAWPILIPMWLLFWIFVLFEWLLSEKEPFKSRLDFLLDDTNQQKQKFNIK